MVRVFDPVVMLLFVQLIVKLDACDGDGVDSGVPVGVPVCAGVDAGVPVGVCVGSGVGVCVGQVVAFVANPLSLI